MRRASGSVEPGVSEFEILQNLFSGIQAVLTVFSLFISIVSGYLGALYFFLYRAPFALRLSAFLLLSISFVFLGGTAAVVQQIQDGLFAAHTKLSSPAIDLALLRNPIPVNTANLMPYQQQQVGVMVGWVVATAAYVGLFYLTFFYRWPRHHE